MIKIETLDACNRCGKCCHYVKDNKVVKCKNLIEWTSGRPTSCGIWDDPKRVGTIIDIVDGKPLRCTTIDKATMNYEGCPYNQAGRALFPI